MPTFARRRQFWAGLFLLLAILLTPAATGAAAERQDDTCADVGPSAACQAGAVYTLTNAPAGNAVLAYHRAPDGSLAPAGAFATVGAGNGAGLGSQGAVIVSDDHRLLFAVNAGSNSISSFRVRPDGLELVGAVPSGGTTPTSLAYRRGLLYVLNAGVPNTIAGLAVGPDGSLTPLADSTRPLSAASTSPAQVGFDARSTTVSVTESATNRIDTYRDGPDGRLTGPGVHPSAGPTPFGFAVTRQDTLLVTEVGVGDGAPSYRIGDDGALARVRAIAMTGQRAECWAVVTPDGRFGYATNAGTGNVSGFALARDGSASLLDADGVTAVTGGNPTDVAVSHDGRFLYARVAATNSIAVFAIGPDGALQALLSLPDTPAGLTSLAAH